MYQVDGTLTVLLTAFTKEKLPASANGKLPFRLSWSYITYSTKGGGGGGGGGSCYDI